MTLMELVMAMVILGAIAIPTGSMIVNQIQGMVTSTNLTAAGNVARLEMEKLNNTAYASVLSPGSEVIPPYTVRWTFLTTTSGTAERKDITMTVERTGSATTFLTIYGTIAKNVVYSS